MKPRLIYKAGFTVTGLTIDGDRLEAARDGLWERLGERFREIPQADPDVGYGVVWTQPDDGISYLAGLSGRLDGEPPMEMVSRHFGPQLYAVFHHAGLLSTLRETVGQVFSVWLLETGLEANGEHYFEVYDDRFSPGEADSIVFLWVPVRKGEENS